MTALTLVRRILATITSLALTAALHAQAPNAAAISGQIVSPGGQPAANAVIRVCNVFSIGNPCLISGVQLYADANFNVPILNPQATDQYGNYSFFLASGLYLVQITPQTGLTYSYSVSAGAGSGGAGGTVTSVSGIQANGFLVSVTNPTTTPAISVATAPGFYLPTSADQTNWNGKVNRSGDTMTGALVLPGDPISPLQASDKNYVDTGVNSALLAASTAQTQANLALSIANAAQPLSQKGQPNGYAPLDNTTRVPRINLPTSIAYTDVANTFVPFQFFNNSINVIGTTTTDTLAAGPGHNIKITSFPSSTSIGCLTFNGICGTGVNVGLTYTTGTPDSLSITYGNAGTLTIASAGSSPVPNAVTFAPTGNVAAPGLFGGGTALQAGATVTNTTLLQSGLNCNPTAFSSTCRTNAGTWNSQFSSAGGVGALGSITFNGSGNPIYVPPASMLCMATGRTDANNYAGIDVVVSGSSTTTLTFNLVNASANTPGAILTVKYLCTW